ncbi:hypothetical protein BKA69DRAFT_760183 [Paraphysoderma sedebokerense]|nr:hypothetical protein BKA69DRAFT_760183 [Paraphysoderma sedebokerense]
MIILIDAIEYHYKLPSPRLDYVFQFFLRQRSRNRSTQQAAQTFQSQQQQSNSARVIVDFFVQNVVFIASFAILGFAVTIPSFLTLPLLCWSCVVLLTDSKATVNKTFILALLLSLGILAEAVVFNLHGFDFSEREDLSLTRQNAVYFYVQTSLLLISSVVYNIYISSRRFRNGRQRTASTGSDFQDLAVTTGPPSLFSQLKSSSIMFWNAFKHVVWKYSYLFSLGIVITR